MHLPPEQEVAEVLLQADVAAPHPCSPCSIPRSSKCSMCATGPHPSNIQLSVLLTCPGVSAILLRRSEPIVRIYVRCTEANYICSSPEIRLHTVIFVRHCVLFLKNAFFQRR